MENENIFDRANRFIRDSDASLVNLLSAIAPWIAPLAPAYTTWGHMTQTLSYPPVIAFFVALAVEILGLSTVSTIISFWSYNKRNKAEYKKAPMGLAIVSFVSYFTVIIVVNIALDSALIGSDSALPWFIVSARGLLTLLSIPAAILLATRTQHSELIKSVERDKAERKAERLSAPVTSDASGKKQFKKDVASGELRAMLEASGSKATPEVIADIYQVSTRTAYRWLAEAKEGN